MLSNTIRAAMCRARYEIPGDGAFYGEIPGFDRLCTNGEAVEVWREELEEVLEDWSGY